MEVKLGGWSRPPMPKMLKVSSSTQGEMAYHCCIDMKLGGWSHFFMLKIPKVIQGHRVKVNVSTLFYGYETW